MTVNSPTACDGGYEDGYRACDCFWGRQPGSLIQKLLEYVFEPAGMTVLDTGCGEGRNAIYLARLGANVRAVDISSRRAIANAQRAWPDRNCQLGSCRCPHNKACERPRAPEHARQGPVLPLGHLR